MGPQTGKKAVFSAVFQGFLKIFSKLRTQNLKNQGILCFGTSEGAKTLCLPLFFFDIWVLLGMPIAWSSSGLGDDSFQ